MQDDDLLSFNFWPSFADIMLAVVLVLCLSVGLVSATIAVGTVDLRKVEDSQMRLIKSIASKPGVDSESLTKNDYKIYLKGHATPDLEFHNDLTMQRITFSENILFDFESDVLKAQGKEVLQLVGEELQQQLPKIREIQVQGHADILGMGKGVNIRLGASRAIAVFEFLQREVGIDPAEHLMSATSFGEYQSVQRREAGSRYVRGVNDEDGKDYTREKLSADNADEVLRERNRRIELVIIYRR